MKPSDSGPPEQTPSEYEKRLEELFFLAGELEPEDRAAFLDRHCVGDAALREDLASLLHQDDDGTRGLLERGLFAGDVHVQSGLPEYIERYRILHRIGSGGMGSVWLARQEEPIRRRVALKFLHRDLSAEALERFARERQTLARMEHPGIARIFDGGAWEGRLWFAMEFAQGRQIDRYCDREQLDVRARIGLFLQVCDAVQHAHQRGVIHRDIKPANVLVHDQDGAPVTKLIDFGIAVATATSDDAAGALRFGTLHYMSPEQVDARGCVDTRTDVYALGVLLYRLLSGCLPFRDELKVEVERTELARFLRSQRPLAPSRKLEGDPAAARKAERRSTTARQLVRQLRRELDAIVLAAIRIDPDERYSTVAELAGDLRRHLDEEPVSVQPPGPVARLQKAFRRNPAASVAAGLMVLSVLSGGVGTTIGMVAARRERDAAEEMRRAESRQRTRAEAVTNFMVETLAMADPTVAMRPDVTVEALLASAGHEAATVFADDPASAATVYRTIGRAYWSLGDIGSAERYLQRALTLLERIPDVPEYELYETMWKLVALYDESDSRKGLFLGSRASYVALDLIERSAPELAESLRRLWHAPHALSALDIRTEFERARSIASRSMAPGDPLWHVLSDAYGDIGFLLELTRRIPAGVDLLEESLRLKRELLEPSDLELGRHLSWLISVHVDVGNFDRAQGLAVELIDNYEAILPADHWLVAEARSQLGACRLGLGDPEEARELLLGAHERLIVSRGRESRAALRSLQRIVSFLGLHGTPKESERYRGELISALAFSKSQPLRWGVQSLLFDEGLAALVEPLEYLSTCAWERDPERSERSIDEALDEALASSRQCFEEPAELAVLVGRQLAEWSMFAQPWSADQRARMAQEAWRLLEPVQERVPSSIIDLRLGQGQAALARGDFTAASEALSAALEISRGVYGARGAMTLTCEILLCEGLIGDGQRERASEWLRSLRQRSSEIQGVDPNLIDQIDVLASASNVQENAERTAGS